MWKCSVYLAVLLGLILLPTLSMAQGADVCIFDVQAPASATRTVCTEARKKGFIDELFAMNFGHTEDFTFDSKGNLWVGLGFSGHVIKIEFNEDTPLPIDARTLRPKIIRLGSVFGLAFNRQGNLFIPEFCSGTVRRIPRSRLEGSSQIDARRIPPLTVGLGCPDGAAFAPRRSPFGMNLFIGDVSMGGVIEIGRRTGAVIAFTPFSAGIEEVIFSRDGHTMFAISPEKIFARRPGRRPTVLATGFAFADAIAQGPGNQFGTDLYVGDLHGNMLFRVNPETGAVAPFADLGPNFGGFEDIIFDQAGRMYILGFGRGGQIIRISPE